MYICMCILYICTPDNCIIFPSEFRKNWMTFKCVFVSLSLFYSSQEDMPMNLPGKSFYYFISQKWLCQNRQTLRFQRQIVSKFQRHCRLSWYLNCQFYKEFKFITALIKNKPGSDKTAYYERFKNNFFPITCITKLPVNWCPGQMEP